MTTSLPRTCVLLAALLSAASFQQARSQTPDPGAAENKSAQKLENSLVVLSEDEYFKQRVEGVDLSAFEIEEDRDAKYYNEAYARFKEAKKSIYRPGDSAGPPRKLSAMVDSAWLTLQKNALRIFDGIDAEYLSAAIEGRISVVQNAQHPDSAALNALLEKTKTRSDLDPNAIADLKQRILFTRGLELRNLLGNPRQADRESAPGQFEALGRDYIALALERSQELAGSTEPQRANLRKKNAQEAAAGILSIPNEEIKKKLCAEASEEFQKTNDPELKAAAEQLSAKLRGVKPEGKELKFEGTALDGSEIEWKDYQGKVVLIVVSPEKRDEIADRYLDSVQKVYDERNKEGFEVLEYSYPRTTERRNWPENKIRPWKKIPQDKAEIAEDGQKIDPIERYGLSTSGINQYILVGKDGRAVGLVHQYKIAQSVNEALKKK